MSDAVAVPAGSPPSSLLLLVLFLLLLCCFGAAAVTAVDCDDIVIDASNEANVATLFGSCATAHSLTVSGTTQLQNLDALAGLARISGVLAINGSNAALTTVSLPQLVSTAGFEMTAAAVTSLTVAALETVGNQRFSISNSPALISVQLPLLRNGSITIGTCHALTSLHMPSLELAGCISLEALPSLINDVDFSSLCTLDSLALKGVLPFLDQSPHAFASLQNVGFVSMNASGSTSLLLGGLGTRFSLLSTLSVKISNEPNLVDLTGLAVPRMLELHIQDCSSLLSLAGSTTEWKVESVLEIFDCPSLRMLWPQRQLITPDALFIRIQNCSQLQSLAGLEGLLSVGIIDLRGLAALVDLSALSSLGEIQGDLVITGCDSLVNLHGLNELWATFEGIEISNNEHLRTLDGLDSLKYVPEVIVENNPMLRNISALRSIREVGKASIKHNDDLCCPSFAFFAATKLVLINDLSCIICTQFGAFTPSELPFSGGVVVSIPYTGVTPYNSAQIRLCAPTCRPPLSECTMEQSETKGEFRCMLLAVPGAPKGNQSELGEPATFEMQIGNFNWFPLGQSTTLVPFSQWALVTDGHPHNTTSSVFVTDAPGIPEPATGKANTAAVTIVATLGALAALLVIAGALLLHFPHSNQSMVAPMLLRLDKLWVVRTRLDSPPLSEMFRQVSAEGGLLTVGAVIVVVAILAAYTAQLSIDNTLVLQSVNPSPSSSRVVASFCAELTLSPVRYFGSPTNDCREWFNLHATGFSSASSFDCTLSPLPADSVTISWRCSDCVPELSNGNISIQVPAWNAFTNQLDWSFSSTDYFGGPSTVSGVMTAATDSFFKGNEASSVQLVAVATNYTGRDGLTKTGTLMKPVAVKLGSRRTAADFGEGSGITFEFHVAAAADLFVIQLQAKQTAIAIFAQCLAIIGGVFSAGRLILAAYWFLFQRRRWTNESDVSDPSSPSNGGSDSWKRGRDLQLSLLHNSAADSSSSSGAAINHVTIDGH
jgi:hypothetical protein